jgi:hypothetical protein
MPAYKLAVFNHSDVPQLEIDGFLGAARQWLTRLAQYWPEVNGTTIRAVPAGENAASDEAWLVIAPNTTVADSLGYHQWTVSGLPTGIVEMDACRQHNVAWTIPGTHEIGELLINPRLDQYVAVGNFWYPKEICDPVTSDQFSIGPVAVANAVTPAWFDRLSPITAQFDLLGNVHAPIPQIPKGGWVEWWDGQTWQHAWGAEIASSVLAYMNSRRGRRFEMRMGHERWRYSTIAPVAPGAAARPSAAAASAPGWQLVG